ncbi:MAG: hypothetical protein M1822_009370 [Bathelium mastoideum]|nr:MAG: hypothetical protein M1822_009370 [Bathelium mastoideum]
MITPTKFRTAHQNIHLTHRSYATVFTSVSLFALATHAWFTGVAILDNTPPIHSRHRSVFSWPFHYSASEEHPNHLQEAEVAVSSLLGAIGDHPAVNAVGWDVLLSTVSLGVWCIVHGVDVDGMIGCGIWPWHNSAKDNSTEAQSPKHVTFDRAAKQEDGDTAQPSPKKKGRARSTKKSNDITSGIVDEASKSAQKIGEAISGSTRRRRTRNRDHHAEDGEDADDDDYVPDRTTAAELASWEHEEDHSDTGTEAGALAWGLWAIGGLGFATASALGSEVVEA